MAREPGVAGDHVGGPCHRAGGVDGRRTASHVHWRETRAASNDPEPRSAYTRVAREAEARPLPAADDPELVRAAKDRTDIAGTAAAAASTTASAQQVRQPPARAGAERAEDAEKLGPLPDRFHCTKGARGGLGEILARHRLRLAHLRTHAQVEPLPRRSEGGQTAEPEQGEPAHGWTVHPPAHASEHRSARRGAPELPGPAAVGTLGTPTKTAHPKGRPCSYRQTRAPTS